jgi:hypothetical protein
MAAIVLLRLAIACIEQERDDGSMVESLVEHLSGQRGIHHVEGALRKRGIATESNIVPLVPLTRKGNAS